VQIVEVQDKSSNFNDRQCMVVTFTSDGVQTSQTKFHKDVP
jgi:hypothetical protein